MARFFLWLSAVIVVAAGVAVGAYVWFAQKVEAPGPLANATTVIINPGTGTAGIARILSDAKVVPGPLLFELQVRRAKAARALKPGEYRFEPGTSIVAAIDRIVRHDVVARFVTVPEGLVTAAVLQIVNHAEGLKGDITQSVADGDLLPETYRYEWGDSRDAVVTRMRAARKALLDELWNARAPGLPLDSQEQALVLASIVEKETGIAAERPHVASVFINRLKRGMKLQSDPTVIYGLAPQAGELNRGLTRADLEQPTPFNTYIIDGLPPAPICNPGRAAIAAVLTPINSDDLYFVADGTGGHVFAATLDAHNRNVAHWHKIHEQGRQQ
jgi:UPF0755 protein